MVPMAIAFRDGNRSGLTCGKNFFACVRGPYGLCMDAWKLFSFTEAAPSMQGTFVSFGI